MSTNINTANGNESKNTVQRTTVSIEVPEVWASKFRCFAVDRGWSESDLFVLMCERYEATVAPFYPLASAKGMAGRVYDYGIFKAE